MEIPVQWLLSGDPWVQYRTRVDLMGQADADFEAAQARQAMLSHPKIQGLIEEISAWPGAPVSSHKNAGLLMHKLSFLAEIGLKAKDPGMDLIAGKMMSGAAPEGPFRSLMNVPVHFGGSGKDELAWALCDAPLLTWALVSLGLPAEPKVQASIEHLASLMRDNGWPCAVSKEMGRFRGPGRKDDPCPYANLVMLKLLSAVPEMQDSSAAHTGAETLLSLWENSRTAHPYIFYMGDDFRKLKAPLVWYDLLHVLDVLSHFAWLKGDPRLADMAEVARSKANPNGQFTPESAWTAWKDWEFGQKKQPSPWLTLLAWRSLQRIAL